MGAIERMKENQEKLKALQDKGLDGSEVELDEKPEVEQEVKEEVKLEVKPEVDNAVKQEQTEAQRNAKAREQRLAEKVERQAQELASANARAAALEAARKPEPAAIDQEPNRAEDPEAHLEWRNRRLEEKIAKIEALANRSSEQTEAIQRRQQMEEQEKAEDRGLLTLERQAQAQLPDFNQVRDYLLMKQVSSMKALYPYLSDEQASVAVYKHLKTETNRMLGQGYDNPLIEMYNREKSSGGYQPPAPKDEKEEELRPDLSKVAKNRARNSGMAGVSGRGQGGELTASSVVGKGIPAGEYAKLSKADKAKVLDNLKHGRA